MGDYLRTIERWGGSGGQIPDRKRQVGREHHWMSVAGRVIVPLSVKGVKLPKTQYLWK